MTQFAKVKAVTLVHRPQMLAKYTSSSQLRKLSNKLRRLKQRAIQVFLATGSLRTIFASTFQTCTCYTHPVLDELVNDSAEQAVVAGKKQAGLRLIQPAKNSVHDKSDPMQQNNQTVHHAVSPSQESLPSVYKNHKQSTIDNYLYPERRMRLGNPPESTTSPFFSSLTQTSDSTSKQMSASNLSGFNPRRSDVLAAVSAETKSILPDLLKLLPQAAPKGILYATGVKYGNRIHQLNLRYCPRHQNTKIRVVNADTIDAAIKLTKTTPNTTDSLPVCVLNMASEFRAGGGWVRGALAQEEALCYRSSLIFTLKLRYYPIPTLGAIYSPSVVVIRESLADGHKLLDLSKPDELPILSAVSIAALRGPAVTRDNPPGYRNSQDREIMKEKMRIALRVVTVQGHRRLVLGALGCGAFLNPKEEVAACWAEVFAEKEFGGGWWEDVLFAVLDDGRGVGNLATFTDVLDGVGISG